VSAGVLAGRVFSLSAVGKLVNVTSSVAFLCWAAPGLLVPALPGIAASLAGRPDALQAGLISHYICRFFHSSSWRRSTAVGAHCSAFQLQPFSSSGCSSGSR
jgi:hypothetical protein